MTAVAQPSGTVTLMFTDIEGSTRLLEELGTNAYRDALAEHRRIVRDACARHAGYEVDYEGDAFFYAFSTAQAAVSAVSRGNAGARRRPDPDPGRDPHRRARARSAEVHRDRRPPRRAHHERGPRRPGRPLPEPPSSSSGGIELKDLGNHRLKDLRRTGARSTSSAPGSTRRSSRSTASTSPFPRHPSSAATHELQAVVQLLADPDLRLLTLTGPGGTGKTRLAIQAAADAADDFPDGVTWVPLASLRDPALVASTIARALELGEEAGPPVDTVARALAGKRSLLLIDNLEHLLPDAAVVLAELLAACPTLRLLVTSRERLAVQGEHEHSVEPLGHDDAVDLLLARAGSLSVQLARDAAVSATRRSTRPTSPRHRAGRSAAEAPRAGRVARASGAASRLAPGRP